MKTRASKIARSLLAWMMRARAQGDPWLGRFVFPREQETPIRNGTDVVGTFSFDARVLRDERHNIRIRHREGSGPNEGYVNKVAAIQLDDAVGYFTAIIEREPENVWAWHCRGRAWWFKREYNIAIKDLSESLRLAPDAHAYHSRAIAYHANGDNDRALKDFDESIHLDAKCAGVFNNRSLIWKATGEYDRALSDCDEAIRLAPTSARAYNSRARVWQLKGDGGRALSDYNEAVRLDPICTAALVNRAGEYCERGDYDRAITDLTEAIRLDPKLGPAFYARAGAYYATAKFRWAIADYHMAIRLEPENANAYYGRAIMYYALKEYGRAFNNYDEAVRLDPECSDALNWFAWLLATCPKAQFRDGRRAVALALNANRLTDGKDAKVLATLAAAYAEIGDFDNAVRWQIEVNKTYATDDAYRGGEERLTLYRDRQPYRQP